MAKDKPARDAAIEHARWQAEQTLRKLVQANPRDTQAWGRLLPPARPGGPGLLEVRMVPRHARDVRIGLPDLSSPLLWVVYVAGADVLNDTMRRVFRTREAALAAFDNARDGTCHKTYWNRGFRKF